MGFMPIVRVLVCKSGNLRPQPSRERERERERDREREIS